MVFLLHCLFLLHELFNNVLFLCSSGVNTLSQQTKDGLVSCLQCHADSKWYYEKLKREEEKKTSVCVFCLCFGVKVILRQFTVRAFIRYLYYCFVGSLVVVQRVIALKQNCRLVQCITSHKITLQLLEKCDTVQS